MSRQFDKLKATFEKFYPRYKSWVKENSTDLSYHKFEDCIFTMQEASILLLEFADTIKIVLENKEQCLKYVSGDEMAAVNANLNDLLHAATENNYDYFAKRIGELIPCMRPFHLLSMEKMDKKRYREVSDMDKTLREIEILQKAITNTANKVKSDSENMHNLIESITEKNKKLDKFINEYDRQMNKMSDLATKHKNINDDANRLNNYMGQIDNILNGANEQKSKIDSFVNLIQEREEKITSQNVATEAHEEKLKDFSEKYNLNMGEAKKLIDEAHEALNLSTARGLGKAFLTRQKKLADRNVKKTWLWGGGLAVACAVGVGIVIIFLGKEDDAISSIVARTLIMMIFIAVAVFCSKQYAKNRSLEEDYAYKVALVASYPGLAKEFEYAEEMRKEYVVKLLGEVLQDPQRARHDNESLADTHPVIAELKKIVENVKTKIDESKKDKAKPPNP